MTRLLYLMAFSLGLTAFAEEPEIFTNVYVVPPTFLNPPLQLRPSAREVLVNAGIDFPEGASAVYNAATSQLIVKTTEDRMALVESYIESIVQKVEKQIHVTFRELELEKTPQFLGEFFNPETLSDPARRGASRVFESREKFLDALSQTPRVDLPEAEGLKRGRWRVHRSAVSGSDPRCRRGTQDEGDPRILGHGSLGAACACASGRETLGGRAGDRGGRIHDRSGILSAFARRSLLPERTWFKRAREGHDLGWTNDRVGGREKRWSVAHSLHHGELDGPGGNADP